MGKRNQHDAKEQEETTAIAQKTHEASSTFDSLLKSHARITGLLSFFSGHHVNFNFELFLISQGLLQSYITYSLHTRFKLALQDLVPAGNEQIKNLGDIMLQNTCSFDEFEPQHEYQIGFVKKIAFSNILFANRLSHSSLVIRSADKKYAIIGRQSPAFKQESAGVFRSLKQEGMKTKIDDERDYGFLGQNPFRGKIAKSVQFSKQEIEQIISSTDENISDKELCTFFNSNCYSASIYMLMKAIEILEERSTPNPQAYSQGIYNLGSLIYEYAQDNASLGLFNNVTIVEKLEDVQKIIQKRRNLDEETHKQDEAFENSNSIN